jgi:gliding motility-associated-like protein
MDLENNGDLSNSGDIEVRGNIINQKDFVCDLVTPSRIALSGDWTNNDNFISGLSLTEFYGTNQNIGGSVDSRFYNLNLLGSNADVKTLLRNAALSNALNITDAQFDLDDYTFELTDARIPIARSTGFISTNFAGRLHAIFTGNMSGNSIFPLGFRNGGSVYYRPIHVVNAQTGEYFFTLIGENPSLYGMGSNAVQDSLCDVKDEYFYRIETKGNPLHYGLAKNGGEVDYTTLARWMGNWDKWTGSGPQADIPISNLGIQSQAANSNFFVSFGKEMPFVDAGDDILLKKIGATATIDAKGFVPRSASITWTPVDDLNCIDCLRPIFTAGLGGMYTITVNNGPNCIASDSVRIIVVRDDIILPNAFTPNSDNLNDLFRPFLFPNEDLRMMKIYNRWGEKVHDSIEPWDGNYMGAPAQPGVYTFMMEINQLGLGFDKKIYKTGTLTLLR